MSTTTLSKRRPSPFKTVNIQKNGVTARSRSPIGNSSPRVDTIQDSLMMNQSQLLAGNTNEEQASIDDMMEENMGTARGINIDVIEEQIIKAFGGEKITR